MNNWTRDSEVLSARLYRDVMRSDREQMRLHRQYTARIEQLVISYLSYESEQMDVNQLIQYMMRIQPKLHQLQMSQSQFAQQIVMRVAANFNVTRKEALMNEINLEMAMMNVELESMLVDNMTHAYTESYYRTNWSIARRSNIGSPVPRLTENDINEKLNEDWVGDGRIYNTRLWRNRAIILAAIGVAIESGIVGGSSIMDIARAVSGQFGASIWKMRRLLLSEASHFQAEGRYEAYEINKARHFEFIATLDHRTCDTCRELDGQVFLLSERRAGVNSPLMHPHGRSTTALWFGRGEEARWRRARRDDGNNEIIRGNITYNEWVDRFVR